MPRGWSDSACTQQGAQQASVHHREAERDQQHAGEMGRFETLAEQPDTQQDGRYRYQQGDQQQVGRPRCGQDAEIPGAAFFLTA